MIVIGLVVVTVTSITLIKDNKSCGPFCQIQNGF